MTTRSDARRGRNYLGTIHFDIVHGCQLRCVGCPNSTLLPKVRRIALDDFDACLRNLDVKRINMFRLFNYGEPLLHHDLPGALRVLDSQAWSVNIVELSTNAQFVRWDQLEAAMATGVLSRLIVSCDGDGTAESYERLRPPAKWEKLVDFLERAGRLRDRVQPNLQLLTRNVVTSQADRERWKSVLLPRGWTPEFRAWKLLPESALNMTGRQPQPGRGVCMYVEGTQQVYVDWDGTVVPCCVHPKAGELGNLRHQLLSEIFSGAQRAEFVETMRTARETLPICRICEYGPSDDPGPSAGNDAPDFAIAPSGGDAH